MEKYIYKLDKKLRSVHHLEFKIAFVIYMLAISQFIFAIYSYHTGWEYASAIYENGIILYVTAFISRYVIKYALKNVE